MTWRRVETATDTLTLDFVKEYLKINYTDEDDLINVFISASVQQVSKIVQKAILNTDYTDFLEIGSTVPQITLIRDTDPPTAKPLVFYTDTAGDRIEYPATDILYNYLPSERVISLCLTGDLPTVQENSLLEVQWSVVANSPQLVTNARLRLIAGWFENREAMQGNYFWVSGVEALLSPISLVM